MSTSLSQSSSDASTSSIDASSSTSTGNGVPAFIQHCVTISPDSLSNAVEVAEQTVLGLNNIMFKEYDKNLPIFTAQLRERNDIIIGLFSNEGGKFYLLERGQSSVQAPNVPIVYQLTKSICHATMAIYQICIPFVEDSTKDTSWKTSMKQMLIQLEDSKANIHLLDSLTPETKISCIKLLDYNITFLQKCLKDGAFSYATVEIFCRQAVLEADIQTLMQTAARAQVQHWNGVLEGWKSKLGPERWASVYGVVNSLFVTRQNNILYTILLQHMGKEAIQDRLLLLETDSFYSTVEKMLEVLTRIVADRALGEVFFRSYYLMDAELLDSHARKAIEEEAKKKSIQPFLPPQAAFDNHIVPWASGRHADGHGPGNLSDSLVHGDGTAILPTVVCPYKKMQQLKQQQQQQ